ncbi:MAG: hypothetical protein K8R36_01050 [Planctomycetales bacterium]|nr:hypothetical protein [Planctomycetales bacterium]
MNWNNASFVRKVIYLVGIAVLLLPIAALSQPATAGRGQSVLSSGGKLAQLRSQYRLSQAELGEIDPASETMKLAVLGMRGVAVDLLWINALDYQKKKDFTGLELTVKQIIRLQPNFLKVWEFHAHNLSYNSSVEFDSYRDRYAWVKKGIDFLILGTHYNRDEPGMIYQLGWFVGHKIGRADESKQFRRLFKTDEDLHAKFRAQGVEVDEGLTRYDGKPDNWLVAKLWFDKAERAAEYKSIRTKSPLIFYSSGPMTSINAASAMEKDDGIFGQYAKLAWSAGHDNLIRFGNRQIPTYLGVSVQLNILEDLVQREAEAEERLDLLAPGVRESLRKERIASLPKREKEVWDKQPEQRTPEEVYGAKMLAGMVRPTNDEVAAKVPRDKLSQSREIADQLQKLRQEIDMTRRYRGTVNYEYWRARSSAEQTDEGLAARELVHDAEALFEGKKSLNEARKKYDQAWDNWAVVYGKYPELMDSVEAQELVEVIEHYVNLLGALDVKFPADFKLKKVMEMSHGGQELIKRLDALNAAAKEIVPTKPSEKKEDTKAPPAKVEQKPAEKAKAEEKPAPTVEEPAKAKEPNPSAAEKPQAAPK